jgi:uncharacterized membrane protein YdjX (TVP38/TMEM64 family)
MRRLLPLIPIVLLVLGGIWLTSGFGWPSLARNQDWVLAWVAAHRVTAGALFVLSYILTTALALPHAALLTVAGGFLFGAVTGTILTVVGATTGSVILLVVLRSFLGNTLARQRHRIPAAMRVRLERDGFSYLLALRLVPLFPFWLVNLAVAVAGIRLAVFVPATLLGIAPASFVLGSIGAGLGGVLAQGREPDLSVVFSPRVLLPLLALAALSLLPVLVRRRRDA